jgi:SRSO17 transposase
MWRQFIHQNQDPDRIQERLKEYFDGIGQLLKYPERLASFAMYAAGLLGEGERKSVEPIAARAAGDDAKLCERYHDRMCHLLHGSHWDDQAVRQYGVDRALAELTRLEPIESWIIDDTGFLKQGDQSPGVQRQYTGSAGKIANCQIAVSLTVATRTEHLPVNMDLFLPQSWIDDPGRRKRAHIPTDLSFRPKWQIALDMIDQAQRAGIPQGVVNADAWYGTIPSFRGGLTERGLSYVVDVNSPTKVVRAGPDGAANATISVRELARFLPSRALRQVTWREGTHRKLRSRFARVPVRLANPDAAEPVDQVLLIEWPVGENEPTHYTLSTLPEQTTLRELVRRTKQRWRTERVYEDMKGELGLDHFEGRTYPGWHHHVSVVLACYAFTLTVLRRSFPPSARAAGKTRPLQPPSSASLRRFLRDRTARHRPSPRELAAPLSFLPSSRDAYADITLTSPKPA